MSTPLEPEQVGLLSRAETRWLRASAERLAAAARRRRSTPTEENQPAATPEATR